MASRGPSGRGSGRAPRGRDSSRARPAGARGTRPSRTQKASPGSGPQITTRAVILLSVVLLLIASYTASLRAWWGARQDIQQAQAEKVLINAEIAELEDQLDRFDDPAYIKQQARERFGWVMPGEVGYRVIDADGSVRGQVPTLDDPPELREEQWYDRLWGSVETAGTDEADVAPPTDPSEPLGQEDDDS